MAVTTESSYHQLPNKTDPPLTPASVPSSKDNFTENFKPEDLYLEVEGGGQSQASDFSLDDEVTLQGYDCSDENSAVSTFIQILRIS